MTDTPATPKKKLQTPPAILSFPHLADPQPVRPGDKGEPKFKGSFIFTKETDITALKDAALAAVKERWGDKGEKMIKAGQLKWPFRDKPEDIELKGYPEGSTFFNATSTSQPGMVYPWPATGSNKPAQVAQEDIKKVFYPGAIVRASVTAFVFDRPDSKGVAFGLNNLQKLKDGPRMDGRRAAEDEFEADLTATPPDLSDVGAE